MLWLTCLVAGGVKVLKAIMYLPVWILHLFHKQDEWILWDFPALSRVIFTIAGLILLIVSWNRSHCKKGKPFHWNLGDPISGAKTPTVWSNALRSIGWVHFILNASTFLSVFLLFSPVRKFYHCPQLGVFKVLWNHLKSQSINFTLSHL